MFGKGFMLAHFAIGKGLRIKNFPAIHTSPFINPNSLMNIFHIQTGIHNHQPMAAGTIHHVTSRYKFFSSDVPKAMNVLIPHSNHAAHYVSEGEERFDNKEDLSNLMPNPEYGVRKE